MKFCSSIAFLWLAAGLSAQDEPGGESDRRVTQYLQSLSDAELGKKLDGVRLGDGSVALAGNTLLHRIKMPSKRAHIYVLREGSLAMGMPTARAWVEAKGKPLTIPSVPNGEWRESAYISGEVYTFAEIHPGDGLVELSCPTQSWIKSLQERSLAAKWGVESMATVEDPDGETNVRDEDGKVITTVKAGERFLAVKPFAKAAQWEVYLSSGVVGVIHESRIRPLAGEPLMRLNFNPCKTEWKRSAAQREAAAIKEQLKPHPDNYYPTLLRASEGDLSALSRFFAHKFEDYPSERYVRDAWSALHLADDARFAEMLKQHPPESVDVGAMFSHQWTTAPISDGKKYLERHFPRTFELLFEK